MPILPKALRGSGVFPSRRKHADNAPSALHGHCSRLRPCIASRKTRRSFGGPTRNPAPSSQASAAPVIASDGATRSCRTGAC